MASILYTHPTLVAEAFIKAEGKAKRKLSLAKKTELAANIVFPIQAEAKFKNSQANTSDPIAINPARDSLNTILKSFEIVEKRGISWNVVRGKKIYMYIKVNKAIVFQKTPSAIGGV